MGLKSTIKLPNPEGVAAGGTATFRIPVGNRIHALYLLYNYDATNQNLADFTEIRLFINGVIFQRFSATQRNTLNAFDRKSTVNGFLEIPFDRYGLKTVAAQEETALNTGVADKMGRKISSMYMEVDIASGTVIAASDLTLYAKVSDAIRTMPNGEPAGPGTIPFIRTEQRTSAGADTDFQISDLVNPGVNAPDKVALSRVTFIPSTGALSTLKIDRNQYLIFDRTAALNSAIQGNGVRTAQSGYYTIDTGENGQGGDMIDLFGMTDYRYRLGVSTGMTITALSEYLGVAPN